MQLWLGKQSQTGWTYFKFVDTVGRYLLWVLLAPTYTKPGVSGTYQFR